MSRWRSRGRTFEAMVLLLVSTAVRRWVPMRRWARVLGRVREPQVSSVTASGLIGVERRVAIALRSGDRRLPVSTTCLDRAIAGHLMLRRRRTLPRLVVGLNRADPAEGAHAWLVGPSGSVVVGAEVMDDFVPVTEISRG